MADILLDLYQTREPVSAGGMYQIPSLQNQQVTQQPQGADYSVYADPTARVSLQKVYQPKAWGENETPHNYANSGDASRIFDPNKRFTQAVTAAGYTPEEWLRVPPAIKRDILSEYATAEYALFNEQTKAKYGSPEAYARRMFRNYGADAAKDTSATPLEHAGDTATELAGGLVKGVGQLVGVGDVLLNRMGANVDVGAIKTLDKTQQALANAVTPEEVDADVETFNYLMDRDRIGEAVQQLGGNFGALVKVVGPEIAAFIAPGGVMAKGFNLAGNAAKAVPGVEKLTGNAAKLWNYITTGGEGAGLARRAAGAVAGGAGKLAAGDMQMRVTAAMQELGGFHVENYLKGRDPNSQEYQDALELVFLQQYLTQGVISGTAESALFKRLKGVVPDDILTKKLNEVKDFVAKRDAGNVVQRAWDKLQSTKLTGVPLRVAGSAGREGLEEGVTSGYQNLVTQALDRGGPVTASTVADGDFDEAARDAKYGAVVGAFMGGVVHPVSNAGDNQRRLAVARQALADIDNNLQSADTTGYTINPAGVQMGRGQSEAKRTEIEQEFDAGNYTNLENYRDLATEYMTRTQGILDKVQSGELSALTTIDLSRRVRENAGVVTDMLNRIKNADVASESVNRDTFQGRYNGLAGEFEKAYKAAGFKKDDTLVSGVADSIRSLVDPNNIEAVRTKLADIERHEETTDDRSLAEMANTLRRAIQLTEDPAAFIREEKQGDVETFNNNAYTRGVFNQAKQDFGVAYTKHPLLPQVVKRALGNSNRMTLTDISDALQQGLAELDAVITQNGTRVDTRLREEDFLYNSLLDLYNSVVDTDGYVASRQVRAEMNRRGEEFERASTEQQELAQRDVLLAEEDAINRANDERLQVDAVKRDVTNVLKENLAGVPADPRASEIVSQMGNTIDDVTRNLTMLIEDYRSNLAYATSDITRQSIGYKLRNLNTVLANLYGNRRPAVRADGAVHESVFTLTDGDLNRARTLVAVFNALDTVLKANGRVRLDNSANSVQMAVEAARAHEMNLATTRENPSIDLNQARVELHDFLDKVLRKEAVAPTDGTALRQLIWNARVDASRNEELAKSEVLAINEQKNAQRAIREAEERRQRANTEIDMVAVRNAMLRLPPTEEEARDILLASREDADDEVDGKKPQDLVLYRSKRQDEINDVNRVYVDSVLSTLKNADGTVSVETGTGSPSKAGGYSGSTFGAGTYYTSHHRVSVTYTSGRTKPILAKALETERMVDMTLAPDTALWTGVVDDLALHPTVRQNLDRQLQTATTNGDVYMYVTVSASVGSNRASAANQVNDALRARGHTGIIYPAYGESGNYAAGRVADSVSFVVFPDSDIVRDRLDTDKGVYLRQLPTSNPLLGEPHTVLQQEILENGVSSALAKVRDSYEAGDPRKVVLDTLIKLTDDTVSVTFRDMGVTVGGTFNASTGEIVLNSRSSETDIDLVHELTHAYTVYALENYEALTTEQKVVVDEIRAAWAHVIKDPEVMNLFPQLLDQQTGVHEFVAEMMSNPQFQVLYDRVVRKSAGSGIIATVREFFRRLAELIGIKPSHSRELYRLIKNTTSLFAQYQPGTFSVTVNNLNRTKARSIIFGNRTHEQGRDNAYAAHAVQDDETEKWGLYWFENDVPMSVEGMTEAELMTEAQRRGLVPRSRSAVSPGQKYIADKIDEVDNYSGALRKMFQGIQRVFPEPIAESMIRGLNTFIQWASITQDNHYAWMTTVEKQIRNQYGAQLPREMETVINRLRQRANAEMEQFGSTKRNFKDHYEELTKLASQSGMTMDMLDDLVYAMRAPEFRRRKLRSSWMKDGYYKGKDLLTGTVTGFWWTDERGQRVYDDDGSKFMAKLTPAQRQFADTLKKAIIDMNNNTLDFELNMGRIDRATYDDLYGEFYVPLQNAGTEAQAYSGRISGRYSKAGNPLAKYIANTQARINNAVDSAAHAEFAALLKQYPVPQMAVVESAEFVKRPDSVEHVYAAEGLLDGRSRAFYVDGKRSRIAIRDETFVRALAKRRAAEKDSMMNTFIRWAGTVTRTLAMTRTVLAPMFHLKAFIRDNTMMLVNTQAASRGRITDSEALHLSTVGLARMWKSMPMILKGQYDKKKADWRYRVYLNEGGINPMAHYDTDKIVADLDVLAFGKSRSRQLMTHAARKFMDVTHASDNASRFAIWYEYLVMKHGNVEFRSEDDLNRFLAANPDIADTARDMSKNITGNFEQKGSDNTLRAFFMFWNAIMSGIKTTYHLFNPQHGTYGLKAAGLLMLMAFAMAHGDDEEDEDGTPLFKSQNRGSGSLCFGDFCIQIAQELRPALHVAQALGYLMSDKMTVGEAVHHVYKGVQDGVMPFQSAASDDVLFNTMYAFTPTALQPLTSMAFNKTYFGSDVVPSVAYDQTGKWIDNPRDHERQRASDTTASQWFTKTLYDTTGFDVAPGNVDLLFAHFGGQAFRFMRDISNGMRFEGKDPFTSTLDLVANSVSSKYNKYALQERFEQEYLSLQEQLRTGESFDALINLDTRSKTQDLKRWYDGIQSDIRGLTSSSGRNTSELFTEKKQLEFQLHPPVDEILRINEELEEIDAKKRAILLNAIEQLREKADVF